MSTRVVISVPTNNHMAAQVIILGLDNRHEWVSLSGERVAQGQCVEKLVYASQRIMIEEVE